MTNTTNRLLCNVNTALAIYVRNWHQVVSIHRLSTNQFESMDIDVIMAFPYTIIAV